MHHYIQSIIGIVDKIFELRYQITFSSLVCTAHSPRTFVLPHLPRNPRQLLHISNFDLFYTESFASFLSPPLSITARGRIRFEVPYTTANAGLKWT